MAGLEQALIASAQWVEVASRPLYEPDGRPYGAMSTPADVTGRVERERRIRHQAETDELTGLANRRALLRTLTAALARAEARGLVVGVLMLDLDGFKAVNDRHGHAVGGARAALHAAAGVACYPVDGGDLDDLLTAADRDMYARKGRFVTVRLRDRRCDVRTPPARSAARPSCR